MVRRSSEEPEASGRQVEVGLAGGLADVHLLRIGIPGLTTGLEHDHPSAGAPELQRQCDAGGPCADDAHVESELAAVVKASRIDEHRRFPPLSIENLRRMVSLPSVFDKRRNGG